MTDTILRQIPVGQYEYVDVEFEIAHQPVAVRYTLFKIDEPSKVRWMDISLGGFEDGTVPQVYKLLDDPHQQSGPGFLILRSTVAPYKTRLLLFTERI